MALQQRMPALGRRLREARLTLDRPLRALAAVVRLTPQFVSEVELGKRLVGRATLERLIDAYELEAERPALAAAWLAERARHDRVLGRRARRGASVPFMHHVRRRRIELGLTHTELQRRTGVASLSQREAGRRQPPPRAGALQIVQALGLPASLVELAVRERGAHRTALFLRIRRHRP